MTSRRSDSGLDGILLIDKPQGWTSHDAVAKARRLTGQRRIGHTGTLDPMATGLLVLCLGRATKLVEYLTGHDKRYLGTVQLGRTTTTDDAEGAPIAEAPVPEMNAATLEKHLERFRGPIVQTPPGFSAVKVAGKRAYALARAGQAPELPARPVTIHALSGTHTGDGAIDIDVTCSSGTYVRGLARDLGAAIGCGGHLLRLRRLTAGPFSVGDALTIDGLAEAVERGSIEELLLEPDDGLLGMMAALVGEEAVRKLANGGSLETSAAGGEAIEPVRIYGSGGEFVGVGSVSSLGELRASKVILRAKTANSPVMFDSDSH